MALLQNIIASCHFRNHFISLFYSIHGPSNFIVIEPGREKTCLMPYANNKGADQPAHPRSLISTFVVSCLDSMIALDSIAKISRL